MKRLLAILASLLIGSVCLMAQKTYIDNGGVSSALNQVIDLKPSSLHIDLGIGESFEIGCHLQHNFNRFFSIDILSARYIREFSKGSNQFIAMTGVRGYTPAFGKRKRLKVYLAADFGYGGYGEKYRGNVYYTYNGTTYSKYVNKTKWNNSFAISPEFGIYLTNHLCLGVNITHMNSKNNPVSARIGFEF